MNYSKQRMPKELQNWQEEKKMMKSKRRSKRAEVKEIFECQCGKNYLSFSALYLHGRNKHDTKFSSKPQQEVCIITKLPSLTKFNYLLSHNQGNIRQNQELGVPIKQHQLSPEVKEEKQGNDEQILAAESESFILQVVNSYLRHPDSNNKRSVIYNFLKMVFKNNTESGRIPQSILQDAPYSLNQYVLSMEQEVEKQQLNSEQWENICQQLFIFCDWLRRENKTNLIVLYDRR